MFVVGKVMPTTQEPKPAVFWPLHGVPHGMPRSTDGGTGGKASMTRWNPFMVIVVVVEVRLERTTGRKTGDFFLPIGYYELDPAAATSNL